MNTTSPGSSGTRHIWRTDQRWKRLLELVRLSALEAEFGPLRGVRHTLAAAVSSCQYYSRYLVHRHDDCHILHRSSPAT
jgi:hypothetical protein